MEALLDRPELLATDPLVERELKELKSEAEAALRQSLERLMNPDRGEVVWLSGPSVHSFAESGTLGGILSHLFEERFPHTPRIANEQVVRRKVSAVTRSARKRCMLAIIERTGIRALGYEGATSADASIYRTVFERTGLYGCINGAWRWRMPSELDDLLMGNVWSEIERFFTQPSQRPKSVEDLIDRLTAPPIGLREGVLPLLLTAGMIAFGRALALRELVDGRARYVDDIQPSLIEKMCEEPKRFELEVPALTSAQSSNLKKMIRCLVGDLDPQEPDLLRGLYDALLEWRSGLPPTALSTKGLGENADLLQPLLRKKSLDPLNLLFRELPQVLGEPALNAETIEVFATAVSQIEGVSSAFAHQAIDVAAAIFSRRLRGSARPLLDAASEWAACVPLGDDEVRALDHEARGVLARARSSSNSPRGARGFVTQLSGILCGEGFEAWDDRTIDIFRARLDEVLVRIEDAVLERADGSEAFEPFLRNKLANIFDVYGSKIGRARLIKYLDEIYRGTP